jgi:hypothetical protein
MWAVLEDEGDRELLFEGTVQAIGARHRRDSTRLRFAVVTAMLADPGKNSRDLARRFALLPLLGIARRETFED